MLITYSLCCVCVVVSSFSSPFSWNTYKLNCSNIHCVVCVCMYLYLLSSSLELLDVLSSLFPSPAPLGLCVLLSPCSVFCSCMLCVLRQTTSYSLSSLVSYLNACVFVTLRRKDAVNGRRTRRKKEGRRRCSEKCSSGEENFPRVQCSITISCRRALTIDDIDQLARADVQRVN